MTGRLCCRVLLEQKPQHPLSQRRQSITSFAISIPLWLLRLPFFFYDLTAKQQPGLRQECHCMAFRQLPSLSDVSSLESAGLRCVTWHCSMSHVSAPSLAYDPRRGRYIACWHSRCLVFQRTGLDDSGAKHQCARRIFPKRFHD